MENLNNEPPVIDPTGLDTTQTDTEAPAGQSVPVSEQPPSGYEALSLDDKLLLLRAPSQAERLLATPDTTLLPRHRVASAYIQVALEKGEVSERDVLDYLHSPHIGTAVARTAINFYFGSHEHHAKEATLNAKQIVVPPPTPKRRRPKKIEQSSSPVPSSPFEQANRPAKPTPPPEPPRFARKDLTAATAPPEILLYLHRKLVTELGPATLAAAIARIEDTPYGDDIYARKMELPGHHRHSINVLSDDTLKVCDQPDITLGEDERLIFNILLMFGRFGVVRQALDATGIKAPNKVLKGLRHRVNTHSAGIINVQRVSGARTDVLQHNPRAIRFLDTRHQE